MNILFLCTGNSCRSIMAEALFNSMAPQGVTAQSAGSSPTGVVNPRALAEIRNAGLPTEGLSSKSWDNLSVTPNVVITLCADAAGEACPLYFGKVVRSHWGMPDPAKVEGDDATITAAFAETMRVLQRRITALVALPLLALVEDPEKLQQALDAIAEL